MSILPFPEAGDDVSAGAVDAHVAVARGDVHAGGARNGDRVLHAHANVATAAPVAIATGLLLVIERADLDVAVRLADVERDVARGPAGPGCFRRAYGHDIAR